MVIEKNRLAGYERTCTANSSAFEKILPVIGIVEVINSNPATNCRMHKFVVAQIDAYMGNPTLSNFEKYQIARLQIRFLNRCGLRVNGIRTTV